MFKQKSFIQRQLKNTLIRGFQKTRSLLSYLKNTWILSTNNKRELATNPNTSPEILNRLAKDCELLVRWEVAENPNASSEILDCLSYDVRWEIRSCVAENPNTLPETLDSLANDERYEVRYYVAKIPNTPPETLERLVNDEESYVRWMVAQNPNTPQYLKDYLKIRQFLNRHNNNSIQP